MNWLSTKFFNAYKTIINTALALVWNNNWARTSIEWVVNSKTGKRADIKTTLKCVSTTVEGKMKEKALELTSNCVSDDEKAWVLYTWVKNNVKYVSDKQAHYMEEFWQSPDETWSRKSGDCEDGALLLVKLMELAGIPAFRRKICCGNVLINVSSVGHAYVIYLRESFNDWFVLDWCLLPDNCFFDWHAGISHKVDGIVYRSLWFTFNEEFVWGQFDMVIREGNLCF